MSEEELFEQYLKEFQPEPLVTLSEPVEIPMVKQDSNNIDLAKVNYLNLLGNKEIQNLSEEIIREYGVGTCGPPFFYGATDLHQELVETLAEFLKVEDSVIYTCGFVAISSSIAAYCGKDDVLFVDEKANFAIEQGCIAGTSKIVKFAHNDPYDFRNKAQQEKKKSRKFLIVEGISRATGQLCPLPDFLKVAEEFKIRLFLEESYTLGIFGATGRGLTEYYNIDARRIDIIFGSLDGAIGSIGGFCAGSNYAINLQRLGGTGWLFSAALPTYLVRVVLTGLESLGDKPQIFASLVKKFHEFLKDECKFNVISHPEAPFKIITLIPKTNEAKVYHYCKDKGVHFIHNENGLLIHLNVSLSEDKEKLERIHEVFKGAAGLK